MRSRKCNRCKKTKKINEFHKDKSRKLGVRSICKSCVHTYDRKRDKDPERRFKKYKKGAQYRKLDFNIKITQFKKLTSCPCTYCGDFSKSIYDDSTFDFCGLDRLNSNKGYIKGNIVPCCNKCNLMKGSLSYQEFTSAVKKINKNMFEKK